MEARIIKFNDRIEIETDFNEEYLESFRETKAYKRARFDPTKRRWVLYIKSDLPEIEQLLIEHFEDISTTLG